MTLRTKIEKCENCKWNGEGYDLEHGDVVHVKDDGTCAKCGRSRQQAHPLEESWQKEFDRIFNPDSNLFKDDDALALGITQWREAKDFISQTLAQEREKIIEGWREPNRQAYERGRQEERAKVLAEVREKVEKMLQHYIKGSYYDEAINNVLSLLKDLQVKE